MSRDQGETLSASLQPARGSVPFPRKDSDTSAAELEVQDPDISPWEGHLAVGKQISMGAHGKSQHNVPQHVVL